MGKRLIYASRLMKAREVHEACVAFREQEAWIRRSQMTVISMVTKKEAPAMLPSFSGRS